MKVLRLPTYCYPEAFSSSHLENDRYNSYEKNGIELHVYAPIPSRGIDDATRKQYAKYEELNNGYIKIHRFPIFKEPKNTILRAIRYLMINHKQYRMALKVKDIDVIYGASTPPTQGLYCAKLKKKLSKKYGKKVPFVYNLQDVFPDSLSTTGIAKKGSFIYTIGNKMANKIYDAADVIIVIGNDMKANIMEKGVPEEKIEVVYNWIDTEAVTPIKKENNKLFDELNLNKDTFKVVYAGNLGKAQGLDTLLDSAEILKEKSNIEFIFFGRGAEEERLKKRAENMPNVKFFPLMPMERVPEVYSLADACAVCCKKGTGGAGFPSKTWTIMGCGSPLLVSFDEGELYNTVNDNKLGIATPAEDAKALSESILTLSKSPALADEMGSNARAYVEANASKEICTQKYIDVIKNTL